LVVEDVSYIDDLSPMAAVCSTIFKRRRLHFPAHSFSLWREYQIVWLCNDFFWQIWS